VAAVDVERSGRRVEELLDHIAAADGGASLAAEELVRELVGLYGAALERILVVLEASAPDELAQLAEEPLIAGLLALHDLHPLDVRSRVEHVLEPHRGELVLVEVGEEVVRLRRLAASGCGSAQLLARVEDEILAVAPEVARVEVEGPNGLIPADTLLAPPAWAAP
jgi:hypothetical protein